MHHTFLIPNAIAMETFGHHLATLMVPPLTLYLQGPLGAGKTTLTRGILHGLGYQGSVKSPTYTLIETYACPNAEVVHLDLYRLRDPHELEYLGLSDYLSPQTLCIIEWPETAQNQLPTPDITLVLTHQDTRRKLTAQGHNPTAEKLITTLYIRSLVG